MDTMMETRPSLTHADLPALIARMTGDEKHHAAAHSTLDVLWVLYDLVLRVNASDLTDPERDRFLLSKGHGPQAYFAVLAAKGFIPVETLDTFGQFDSPLGHHPDRLLVPGVEISSGSLGHGLPIALGVALALRAQGRTHPRVFCLIGDGELDEGSNHEAIAAAGRLRLDALTVIAIDNASAALGWPGGVATRFTNEGWAATTVNGHEVDGVDHGALHGALTTRARGVPSVVVVEIRGGA